MSVQTLERPTGGTVGEVAPELAPARSARIAAGVAVLALLVGLLELPAGSLLTPAPFATLGAGTLEIRDGESWRTVPVGGQVVEGAALRVVGGVASLDADGGRVLLGAGVRAEVDEGRLAIERGSVVVEDPAARTVLVGGVEASGRGVWRIDAGSRPRLATYDGSLVASDGSVELALPAYRQVTVRDRSVGGATAVPLRYLATDVFDADLLAEAIRVDAVAAALRRSLAGTYGGPAREAEFYTAFAPSGDATAAIARLASVAEDGRYGPPAEVLLGVIAMDAVATVAELPVEEALDHVAASRAEGATWGVVAIAAGVGADDLAAAADRALTEAAADPPPGVADGVDATPALADPADPVGADGADGVDGADDGASAPGGQVPAVGPGTEGGAGLGGAVPPAGDDPSPSPPEPGPGPAGPGPTLPGPVGDVVEGTRRGLGDVVDGVGGLLDGVGGAVGGVVDGALGGVDQLLGGGGDGGGVGGLGGLLGRGSDGG